ncbi:hypothetical protein BP6252_03904 [Coleophoma cylindrospora]|uniref:Maintenance of telomere capping protein 1 n=1 Tax=Coleophoma cylindrospora TaxID=1849047 RepID=A0A3D8S8W9_9HELO|nr:hypothetical protein BP6252_03904 [Coleophoma cylindrospora]
MATKKSKAAPTDEELNKLLEGIGEDDAPKPTTSKGAPKTTKTATTQSEEDMLAELENLGAQPASRPHTPQIKPPVTHASRASPGKRTTATPPPTSTRTSEDKIAAPRKSVDSTRSLHTSFTPSATSSELQENEKKAPVAEPAEPAATGGGWWGSVFATASAAVKTAEAAVKEIQQNEEAKRWAEQVKGNVGALRGLGGELRSRALPTFTNILHTLAPPISSHERLQIHITHDFLGYPSLDPLIYSTFSRVMAQVEGGDLMVIQRGQEATVRRNSDAGYTGGSAGWNDGPWWRQTNEHRDLGAVKGMVEGTKLVRVSAEAYSNEYFTANGGLELAAQRATENLSESNPVRSSDIFLAVQAISHEAPEDLFQGSPKEKTQSDVVEEKSKPDELISFAIYLRDPVHSITFYTITQSIPAKWIAWLDAPSPLTPASPTSPSHQKSGFFGREGEDGMNPNLPQEIAEIIESGGVDPREWVAEWVEEILSLGTGIVAQRYVARRMGVGEGGIGRGKARMEEVLGDGGGEAARAGLI